MGRITALGLVLLMAFLSRHALAQDGRLRAEGLVCNWMPEPMGVETPQPRLTWIVASGHRAQKQTSYQVLVASSPEILAKDKGDLWDSGRVPSEATGDVLYEGQPLASRQRCSWKVRAWDKDGNPGPWSAPSSWEMGLLQPSDWSAKWVDATPRAREVTILRAAYRTPDGSKSVDVTERVAALIARGEPVVASNGAMGGDPAFGARKVLEIQYQLGGERLVSQTVENATAPVPPSTIPHVRTAFACEKPVARARVYATALGVYELWLNGQRVGDHRMAPGWTDYRKRVQYQVFDVTEQVRAGRNTFGAIVAPGWFCGRAGLFHARAYYGASPALLAQLEIQYADGTRQTIVSDETWQRHDGPTLSADIMDGETFDARLAVDGWCDAGAPGGTGWTPVATRQEARTLVAQTDHPVRALMELPAKAMTQPQTGRWVFDLEQNMVGVVRLRARQPSGTRITIRHAEMLNPDGTLYTENLRGAAATDTYTCRGGGEETWDPRFTFHGFRYVELTGLANPPELGDVTGVVVGADLPRIGTFECSDPRVNQLQSNIVWGMRGNMLSIPTDCPQRDERMGWTADTQVFVPTAAYNADVSAFLAKWLRDVRDAQRDDGAHADVAPVMDGLSYGTPVWGDAGVFTVKALHDFTGDDQLIRDNIDSMRRWVDWCVAHSTDFVRDRDRGNDYGDWLSINADTPKDLIGTAYAARAAAIVAASYSTMGDHAQADRYGAIAASFRDAFSKRFIGPDGSVVGGTQTGALVALRFQLVPEHLRRAVAERLITDLERRGWRLSTGFVGVSHLLPVLDGIDRPDVAYRLLLQDQFPSWLFSVKHGATTIWERWDGWTPDKGMNDPGMNSFNHFALGSCGEWFYSGIAGIRPGRNAFQSFEIRPRITGPLTHARATYRSVRGMIVVDWRVDGDRLTLEIEVPANTEASVLVPSRQGTPVLESGRPLQDAEGLQATDWRQGALPLRAASGRYVFTSTLP